MAGSTLSHPRPTSSSSGWRPSITARYFSASPSDSASRRTPCPPGTASGGFRSALAVSDFRLRARLGFSIPSSLPASEELPPLLDTALLSALYVSSILQDPPTGRAYRLQRFSNSGR